jgi:hypothetical protein
MGTKGTRELEEQSGRKEEQKRSEGAKRKAKRKQRGAVSPS